jgi:hypothetical protein
MSGKTIDLVEFVNDSIAERIKSVVIGANSIDLLL